MSDNTENSQKLGDAYRNRLSIISEQGNRVWIYAKSPRGLLHKYRLIFAAFLLSFFFLIPYVQISGEPFLLLNFLERKFILFGVIFWPQDSYILFLLMITMIVFIILFTVTYGRLWCGWACPQTIFMEILFRKLEYLIEGSPPQQRKLNQSPMSGRKLLIKSVKHLAFWLLAFLIATTTLHYLLGYTRTFEILRNPTQETSAFVGILIFSTVIYFIYSQVRELVCTVICPYGRLQGVLIDEETIVVAYDYLRGEPRSGKRNSNHAGDCIACNNCVTVCPTGIDIRNGTQMECTNCTACIDACNEVMTRVDKPRGLIRYASESEISESRPFRFSVRSKAYTVVLALLLGFLVYLLASRTDVATTILRTPGLIYQEHQDGRISNLYNVKIVNKTHRQIPISIKALSHEGEVRIAGSDILLVGDHSATEGVFFLYLHPDAITDDKTRVEFGIYQDNQLIEKTTVTFVGPAP